MNTLARFLAFFTSNLLRVAGVLMGGIAVLAFFFVDWKWGVGLLVGAIFLVSLARFMRE